eukprot:XP_001698294.1 predicted protein [Chlamydomonas reinhardtii]
MLSPWLRAAVAWVRRSRQGVGRSRGARSQCWKERQIYRTPPTPRGWKSSRAHSCKDGSGEQILPVADCTTCLLPLC